MRLLEYQAKELFKEFGIRTPPSISSKDIEKGRKDAKELGYPFVIKVQVPVGGRGKAGGIQKCSSDDEFELKYPQLLNMSIKGEKTRAILLEKMADIEKELYLSLFLNRSKRCYTIIASSEGGVEIESVKNQTIREVGLGDVDAQTAKEVANEIGLKDSQEEQFVEMLQKLSKLTIEKEAELAEINPLAILKDGTLMALDGKVMTDDNSNFRHDELQQYQEKSALEEQAEKSGFSLVELDGNIAVIGNGAGLVMSTFDLVTDNGGKPATFLDVGGGATTESVYEALTLISKMSRVKGILVNLYGGIVKTTTVAEAFIQAYNNNLIDLPVFARLMGTESDKAKEMLKDTKTKMFDSIEEAINGVVIYEILRGKKDADGNYEKKPVIVQGITGKYGSTHAKLMLEYGTNIVAGVTPGKGGQKFEDKIPVYDTVKEAVDATGAEISIVFVPAKFFLDAAKDALNSGIKLLVAIPEHVPIRDAMEVIELAKQKDAIMIGPNTPGVIVPGLIKVGIMPASPFSSGKVAVLSKSGTLLYEISNNLTSAGFGQNITIGIGGDPVNGTRMIDAFDMVKDDPELEAMVVVGEIGGDSEEILAQHIIDIGFKKPIVGYIAGRQAPKEKRMGHAGAIVMGTYGSAESKISMFAKANIPVAKRPGEVAVLLAGKMNS